MLQMMRYRKCAEVVLRLRLSARGEGALKLRLDSSHRFLFLSVQVASLPASVLLMWVQKPRRQFFIFFDRGFFMRAGFECVDASYKRLESAQ